MDLTYEDGLIVGAKREREYWENKIKHRIEELEKLLLDIDYRDIEDEEERKYYKKEYYQVVGQRNILLGLLGDD